MEKEKRKLNIGIAGFGAMGRTHAYAVANLPFFYSTLETHLPFSAQVYGICTTSAEKSEEAVKDFPNLKFFADFDEMVNSDEIDIIDICTPNIYHYDMIKSALIHGKHVYCEKPLCESYEKSKEIASLAEKSGKICGIVFNNRHLSSIKRAKQIIDEGKIGKITSFNFEYLHDSCTFENKAFGWKQNADVCGKGGVLFDIGSHVIDLAYYLCGEFDFVLSKSQIAYPIHSDSNEGVWKTNASEAFYIIATMKNGAIGTITASKICKGEKDGLNFEIRGTLGAIKFSLMEPGRLHFFDAKAESSPFGGYSGFTEIECEGYYPAPSGTFPSPKAPIGWLRGHLESMYNYLSSVYNGEPCAPDFKDGAYISKVMDAALLSAESHKEEKI